VATPGSRQGRIDIVRKDFRVVLSGDDPYVRLELSSFSRPLLPTVGVDTVETFDRQVAIQREGIQQHGQVERITWTECSTLWNKRHYLDIYLEHLIFHSEVFGTGTIDTIRFFDAIQDIGFVEHFALTKHFNDKGQTYPRDYSTGSPIGFRNVLCPEPNSHAKQILAPFEYAQVSVNADLDHFGGNFVANPGLLAFAVADELDKEWLTLGLAVEPGQHLFSEFEYLGGRTFAVVLRVVETVALRVVPDAVVRERAGATYAAAMSLGASSLSAAVPGLVRSDPHRPGITRARSQGGFRYRDPSGAELTDEETLDRIRALRIPPAWENVWISAEPLGHIQATGEDSKGRVQYIYHLLWREQRDWVLTHRNMERNVELWEQVYRGELTSSSAAADQNAA